MSQEIIITSPAPPLEVPKGNLVNTVFKHARKWWKKPAIECSEAGVVYTYSELLDQIKQWGGFLESFALRPQDFITVISPNCLQLVPIFLGTVSLGIPISFPNPKFSTNEIRKLIFNTGSKFIIYSTEIEDTLLLTLKEDISKFHLFCIGRPVKLKALNVDDILYGKEFISSSWPPEIDGEETALFLFTSGTTGTPKAIELSHNALSNFLYSITNPYHSFQYKPKDLGQQIFMNMLPFSHIGGILGGLSVGLFIGAKIVIYPKISQDAFIEGIPKHKITRTFITPSLLKLLVASPKCTDETMRSLKTLTCGSVPMPKSCVDAFRSKFNLDIDILEGYGMNEILVATAMPRRNCKNFYGCGRLLSNVEAKIICTETGETLGPNQEGEICIKSPSAMKGYLNSPKATEKIMKDGWIHTGDFGYYDSQEFFHVTDRLKDLIKVDGWHVSPSEIENELLKHPLVKECSVIGKPDSEYVELPMAFVVPKAQISEKELQDFLKDKLAEFKQLKGGIKFVESFPKSITGKILKRELREKEF